MLTSFSIKAWHTTRYLWQKLLSLAAPSQRMRQRGERSSCSQVTEGVMQEGLRDRVERTGREREVERGGLILVILHYGQQQRPTLTEWTCDGKRTPFSQSAGELAADAEGRAFPHCLTYSTSHNVHENIDRDWIIYSSSKRTYLAHHAFCSPLESRKGQQVH